MKWHAPIAEPVNNVGQNNRAQYTADLPGYRLDEHAATVDRWMRAVGKLPD